MLLPFVVLCLTIIVLLAFAKLGDPKKTILTPEHVQITPDAQPTDLQAINTTTKL